MPNRDVWQQDTKLRGRRVYPYHRYTNTRCYAFNKELYYETGRCIFGARVVVKRKGDKE